jgi:hypothetical protein
MGFDRGFGNEELLRHRTVAHPGGEELHELDFTRTQGVHRIADPPHEPRGNLGRKGRLTRCGRHHGLSDLLGWRVFEQVSAGTSFYCGEDVGVVVVGGQDQDRRRGSSGFTGFDLAGGGDDTEFLPLTDSVATMRDGRLRLGVPTGGPN